MRRAARLLGFALAVLLACACAGAPAAKPAPDAADFDTITYNTLRVTQAAIEQAKLEAKGRAQILAVNTTVAAYNAAEASFQAYKRGELTAPDVTTITAQVTAAVTEFAKLWAMLHPEEVTP